jgi:hypothetical protein
MNPTIKNKALASILGIIIAAGLFFTPIKSIPILDTKTDDYFSDAITKAGIAYATCRAINASVSVVKDSSLQLEPAGIGVSLAVGQVLDPIDDMTERLSDVLVTAITSLGVQKLSYEIGVSLAPRVFAVFLIILSVLIWFDNDRVILLQRTTTRILIVIAILRFCLPASSLANDYIYQNYFSDEISKTNNHLSLQSDVFEKLGNVAIPNANDMWESLGNSTSLIKTMAIDLKNALTESVSSMGGIIENLLKLTFLYVGIFLIQVIILPILMFWFLVKISNILFQTNIPSYYNSSRGDSPKI